MRTKPSKFLMNEEGASPGGGAVNPPPTEPAATPAAAPDSSAFLGQIASLIDEKLTAQRNGIFADLRKAGALTKDKTPDATAPASQPTKSAPVAAQAGLSMSDVAQMIERDRAITTRATKHGLSDAQMGRMRAALADVSADSLATEADAYLSDMGLAKAPTPAAHAAPTATPAEAPRPPAAAPSAPSGANLPMQDGLVDLAAIPEARLRALGPQFVRAELEKAWKIADGLGGRPQRPTLPSQRK